MEKETKIKLLAGVTLVGMPVFGFQELGKKWNEPSTPEKMYGEIEWCTADNSDRNIRDNYRDYLETKGISDSPIAWRNYRNTVYAKNLGDLNKANIRVPCTDQ